MQDTTASGLPMTFADTYGSDVNPGDVMLLIGETRIVKTIERIAAGEIRIDFFDGTWTSLSEEGLYDVGRC